MPHFNASVFTLGHDPGVISIAAGGARGRIAGGACGGIIRDARGGIHAGSCGGRVVVLTLVVDELAVSASRPFSRVYRCLYWNECLIWL